MNEEAKKLGCQRVGIYDDNPFHISQGITIRQYYAGLAMQGIITSKQYLLPANVAEQAILQADALLEELSKEEKI